jgi:hypothetical protein
VSATPVDPLADECDSFVACFARAPTFLARNKHLAQLETLMVSSESDFSAIAAVSKLLAAAMTEAEYCSLRNRHAALADRVTTRCAALEQTKEFGLLILLGAKLKAIKALDVSALPPHHGNITAVPTSLPHTALCVDVGSEEILRECDTLITQFRGVPSTRAAILRSDELRDILSALTANRGEAGIPDWEAIGRAGNALKAATNVVVGQPLSEEDYLSLADRQAEVILTATALCRKLVAAEDYHTLAAVAAKLAVMRALAVGVNNGDTSNDEEDHEDEEGDSDYDSTDDSNSDETESEHSDTDA